MKTTEEYWKQWWNDRAKPNVSDVEIDRGGSQLSELEQRSRVQFLTALDPQPGDVVLDAGCGTGANFTPMSPLVREIVGIDLAEEQIRRCEHRVAAEHLPNVKLQVGSMTHLAFPDNSFEKVICTSVLQYLNAEECEASFREMIRVCKDGGIIVIHAKNRTSIYGLTLTLLRFISRIIRRSMVPDYYRPRRWYGRTLARHGGQIIDFDAIGLFHFPLLPERIVQWLLKVELRRVTSKFWKRFGVNYKMTVRVHKASPGGPQPRDDAH